MKKIIMLTLIISTFLVVGCKSYNIGNEKSNKKGLVFQGKIVEKTDGYNFIVRDLNNGDLISLNITDEIEVMDNISSDFKVGNLVKFEADAEVMESWPLKVNLYKIIDNEDVTYIKIDQALAKKLMDTQDVIVLDVRTIDEYNEGNIKNSVLLPVDNIELEVDKVIPNKDSTILVYCRSGNRSKTASKKLIDLGYRNVYDFGGINTWEYELNK
ncbi:rhodanese-like domain-containing protein [Clostridium grantii]|uniref:Rhodanese-related sulfurtransferase n=1 Tax=Clostridium grantii DSM 8605 TaxID=1121316 RepID=A0A1M5QI08_9CLOT|nr:rhodanese-like domain-containing protein [Clostridium grantii]SHH13439.1 Rhodanese-related sulfurtransferase [Clostridium grantii DSM 8605]